MWQAWRTALVESHSAGLAARALPQGPLGERLRDPAVQRGVAILLAGEQVEVVLCGTSFASVQFEEAGLGAPLWEALNVPVLRTGSAAPRAVTSGNGLATASAWALSSTVSLQVALPNSEWTASPAGWGLQRGCCRAIRG